MWFQQVSWKEQKNHKPEKKDRKENNSTTKQLTNNKNKQKRTKIKRSFLWMSYKQEKGIWPHHRQLHA